MRRGFELVAEGPKRRNAVAPEEREKLLEVLSDLKHDLGKYIRLPFTMLPPGADWDETRTALRHALLETRSGPGGVLSARALWSRFKETAGGRLGAFSGWIALEAAVERALAWEACVEGDGPLPRDDIERDLSAISGGIQKLRLEVAANG